jgi:preprotein translocase subunit YajC
VDVSAFLFPVAIILIFYLFIIRPQTKKQKERQRMLEAVDKGDDIVTIGGVHGKIVGVKNDGKVFIVKVDDNVKLEIDRTAVSHIKGAEKEKR